jgi:hypothetical protein
MIVLSEALVLSEDPGVNLTHPVFGWHNVVTAANITADTEADNFPVTNLANPSTAEKWKGVVSSPTADEHIAIETGEIEEIDYVAVAGHNWGTAEIAAGLEYLDETQSPSAWVELVAQAIPADDGPLIFRFAPQSIADIRIRLSPGSAAPEAAVVHVGALLVMERGMPVSTPHAPLDFAREGDAVDGMSESGNFLGRIQLGQFSESGADFQHLTAAFYRDEVDPFVRASKDKPFFFAWSPSDYPNDVGFAWMTNSPKPQVDHATGRMAVSFAMRGIV